ncbi:hypothetical protein IDM48_07360 [Rothia amarae]|uniref:Uncharacterized protein n=1 Tax=Rothia amarae TaxID=169480 RepID=A0A7H2BHT4_9MICC|nr:hypothetical protein [Rothia amarae]QNV39230.1 hypothetical protein IDM48_07360 [Rothia amarae]
MTNNPQISRRSLIQGAAWAAPVIIASVTTPAYSASATVAIASSTYFAWAVASGQTVTPYSCAGKAQVQISQLSTQNSYLTVNNLKSTSKVTNLKGSYWLPVQSGTTFTRVANTSTCWSVPVASGKTTTYNGVVFREYTSTYTCPITVSGTSWTQPTSSNFKFVSSCQTGTTLPSRIYHYEQSATVTSASGAVATATKSNGWSNTF